MHSESTIHAGQPPAAVRELIDELDRVRRARGESKAGLARAAGLGEPAVRRLLSGQHCNPTFKTLDALAAHLGLRLTLEADPAPMVSPTLAELRKHAEQIDGIVAAHRGSNVRVFGSVARGEALPESDVDLLVDVQPGTGLFEICAMEEELGQLLGRSVDVVTSAHGRMEHIYCDAVPLR